ncbi:MAG: HD domain-containing protein [Oscillospiraceae bacterium]|nr:HD domain-containing protein [Oscillospiraceae bacterium]
MGKILIVDDSQFNRVMLSDMLKDYEIIEAENGVKAIEIIKSHAEDLSLILLDRVMPEMDGLEVLDIIGKNKLIDDIPIIMISSDDSPKNIHKAYELGVTEFIRRPFDALVVQKRCHNIIALYSKQKKLMDMFADQFYEREKNSHMMVDILAHIVEFRNNECGLHVKNVQTYTEILLRELLKITDKYKLSEKDIENIKNASAFHDIGKISVPDAILNKPGRFTAEEFNIMKSHSAEGAKMLADLPFYKNEPIVKLSYAIARWHHERWDGRGYPDGLKGDDIPISAQVVSLADVYDALTADRVYKSAFTHEKAMEMILNGECGVFNPLLLKCIEQAQDEMRAVKEKGLSSRDEQEIKAFARDLIKNDELYSNM